ncbi:MAG: hypothetical protein OEZ06_17390 [Myxococcales bacterium]|nr:hypothetical protein [Myxococcales bacterium]
MPRCETSPWKLVLIAICCSAAACTELEADSLGATDAGGDASDANASTEDAGRDAQCDALACGANSTCVGEPGACQCVADHELVGDACVPIDDCADAPCVRGTCVDLPADFECACPTGWTGKRCDVDGCESTECDVGESCITGPTCVPTCSLDSSCAVGERCVDAGDCGDDICKSGVCHPGCASSCDDAAVCVKDADCASDYCARDDASALTGVCRPACARAGCATAEPCTRSADCSDAACSGGLCQPSCGTACQPGDACAVSNNCAGTDICDDADHVCLTSCSNASGDYQLTTAADVTNARYCWQIDDPLVISANFATLTADQLPFLQEVTGSLFIQGFTLVEITLPRLRQISGSFAAGNSGVQRLIFPALQQIGTTGLTGTDFTIGLSVATEVDMRALETVSGNLTISNAPDLTTLRFDSLGAVQGSFQIASSSAITTLNLSSLDMRFDISGDITLSDLPEIPWTTFTPFILPLNGNESVTNVGCDTTSPCNCDGDTSCVP